MDEGGHILDTVLEVPEEPGSSLSPLHLPTQAPSSTPLSPSRLAAQRRYASWGEDEEDVNEGLQVRREEAPSRREVARLSEKEGFELEVAEWSTSDVNKCYVEREEKDHPLTRVLSAERLSRGRSGRLPRLRSPESDSRKSSTGSVRLTDHNECVGSDAVEPPPPSSGRNMEAYQSHVDRMAKQRESPFSARSLFSRHVRLPDIIRRPQLSKKEKSPTGRPSTPTPAASTSAGSRKMPKKQARRFSAVSYNQELTDRLHSALSNVQDSDTDTDSSEDTPYSAPARINLSDSTNTATGWFEDHTHTMALGLTSDVAPREASGRTNMGTPTPVLTPTLINVKEDPVIGEVPDVYNEVDTQENRPEDSQQEADEEEPHGVRFQTQNEPNDDEASSRVKSDDDKTPYEPYDPRKSKTPTELDLQVRSSPTVQKYIRWLSERIISEGFIDVKHLKAKSTRVYEDRASAWTVEHDILFRAMLIVENVLDQVVGFMRSSGKSWDEDTAEEAVRYSQSNLNLEEATVSLEALLEEESKAEQALRKNSVDEEDTEKQYYEEFKAAPDDVDEELSAEDIERMVETLVDIITSDAADNIAKMNEKQCEETQTAEDKPDESQPVHMKKTSKTRFKRKMKKASRKNKSGTVGEISPVLISDLPRPRTMSSRTGTSAMSREGDLLSESMSKFPKLPSISKKSAEGERNEGEDEDMENVEEESGAGKEGENEKIEDEADDKSGNEINEKDNFENGEEGSGGKEVEENEMVEESMKDDEGGNEKSENDNSNENDKTGLKIGEEAKLEPEVSENDKHDLDISENDNPIADVTENENPDPEISESDKVNPELDENREDEEQGAKEENIQSDENEGNSQGIGDEQMKTMIFGNLQNLSAEGDHPSTTSGEVERADTGIEEDFEDIPVTSTVEEPKTTDSSLSKEEEQENKDQSLTTEEKEKDSGDLATSMQEVEEEAISEMNNDEDSHNETQGDEENVESSPSEQTRTSEATVIHIDPGIPPQASDVQDPVAQLLTQTSQILQNRQMTRSSTNDVDLKRKKYSGHEEEKTAKEAEGDTGFQSHVSEHSHSSQKQESDDKFDTFDGQSLSLSHRQHLEGLTRVPDTPIRSIRSFGNLSFLSLADADGGFMEAHRKGDIPIESEFE